MQEQDRSQPGEGPGGRGARTQVAESSVGEDRAVLLGFTMMAFSVLMFFVVGITTVRPYINSRWEEEVHCVLRQTHILEEWVDCRGVSSVPCLKVTVNLSGSSQEASLHYDEEYALLAKECFFIPDCQMEQDARQEEVQQVKRQLDGLLGNSSSCFSKPVKDPKHVILRKRYTLRRALTGLLWPSLMMAGGALLVGLVKTTQCLARLSSEMGRETAVRLTSRYTQGKLYRLLHRSSMQSPS